MPDVASPAAPSELKPGSVARVRQRLYLVEEVVPPKSSRLGSPDSTLVRLACLDDDHQGEPLEVLWERELDAEVRTSESWSEIAKRGFDQPKTFAAYLHTLRWNCVTSTDPKLFQAPFRAGIKLDAYQLEPLRKALLLPRVNLFIADDVGLGKTIEAGLIARELLLRKKIREIVVACPPSMLYQWRDELEARFGLTFEILDKEYMTRIRRERGFGVNPWNSHTRFLISHRLLIDEAYVGPLRDWLGDFRAGTLFILDEAHHAAPSSGQKYAVDSQTTRAVRDVAGRFEHRLFLSATPHNGHSNSFSALLEILDPQRFTRGVPVEPKRRDEVLVRRIKEDIREIQGGFAKRHVVQIDIDGLPPEAPELRLSALLDQYRELREERLKNESKRKQAASGLLLVGLQQRLLSSVEAFARTLRVHRETVKRQWNESRQDARPETDTRQLDLLSGSVEADDDRASLSEDQLQAEEESQFARASAASFGPVEDRDAKALFEEEQKLLEQMTAVADNARDLNDARVVKLIAWIREWMCPRLGEKGAEWNDLRIIIFTEWDDTKRYLQRRLQAAIDGSDLGARRIEIYHGPTPPAQREEIKQAFNGDPKKYPVRILIATDAAREGLNLQARCSHLFHFDVPWNPSRMEQRNGRIDRKLQPSPEVWCHYFVYKQRPEDRILQVLVRKTEVIRLELGSLSQVIDSRLAKSLSHGIRRSRLDSLAGELEAADLDPARKASVKEELEAARERQTALRQQIDRLRTLLENSKENVGLDEDRFRSAISTSLEILKAEPLKKIGEGPNGKPRFAFPQLDQERGADTSWAETLDTLRPPRPRDQKLWEWRNGSNARPIVFEDTGALDDSVVHLHLEQRVVQRLLGRFTAQGFVYHDLSRACLAQSSDAIPRVVLLGRLSLYGPGATRLHEELVPVTARWTDPKIRKTVLAPYARDAETKTLSLLDDALLHAGAKALTPEIEAQLRESAARDIEELLPHLETRGGEYADDAAEKLARRAKEESQAMREILASQRKHLEKSLAEFEKRGETQLRLDFSDEEERRQINADIRHWQKKLEINKQELETEPDRIRRIYEVQAGRVEPVGLVYLWPITG